MIDNHQSDQLELGEHEPSDKTEVAQANLTRYFNNFGATYIARVIDGESWEWSRRKGLVAGLAGNLSTRLASDITPDSFTTDALECVTDLLGDQVMEDEGAALVRYLMTDPESKVDANVDAKTMQQAIPSLARAAFPGDEAFASDVSRILKERLSSPPTVDQ